MSRDWEPGPSHEHDEGVGEALDSLIKREEVRHSRQGVWTCVSCSCMNSMDRENCQNCGRDFLGRDGEAPDRLDKDARPGLRSDIGP